MKINLRSKCQHGKYTKWAETEILTSYMKRMENKILILFFEDNGKLGKDGDISAKNSAKNNQRERTYGIRYNTKEIKIDQ